MKTVMVAGDFGKIHSGHLMHIAEAYKLGDWLTIVTHPSQDIILRKGYPPDTLCLRVYLLETFLKGLGGQGMVMLAFDTDGTVAETIRKLRPQVFAKGGGYSLDKLPQNEIDACHEVGCEIVFAVGARLNESRKIVGE